jgi:hypothetical protein
MSETDAQKIDAVTLIKAKALHAAEMALRHNYEPSWEDLPESYRKRYLRKASPIA